MSNKYYFIITIAKEYSMQFERERKKPIGSFLVQFFLRDYCMTSWQDWRAIESLINWFIDDWCDAIGMEWDARRETYFEIILNEELGSLWEDNSLEESSISKSSTYE